MQRSRCAGCNARPGTPPSLVQKRRSWPLFRSTLSLGSRLRNQTGTAAAPERSSQQLLQSRFDDLLRRPNAASLSSGQWQDKICHCIRAETICSSNQQSEPGCQQLQGLLARCAQSTGRVAAIVNLPDAQGYPPLAYGLASGSVELVQLLLDHDADPNAAAHGLPILAFAILSRNDRLVQLLLSFGADPCAVPPALFTSGPKDVSCVGTTAGQGQAAHTLWETDGPLLARCCNVAMQYWLREATRLPAMTDMMRGTLSALGVKRLPALRLMLVGQEAALVVVLDALCSHLVFPFGPGPKAKPLVMLFAGAPGHGKTLLAEELGRLVGAPFQFIDCTTCQHEMDMFGCRKPYQGFEHGSDLVNFLADNNGKRCVVVLDEFEKTPKSVRNGFLRVFNDGEISDWRFGTTIIVDCSKAIFVMTTNAHDNVIIEEQKHNPTLHNIRDMGPDAWQKTLKPLDKKLRQGNIHHFQASMASRIACTVFFLPFNEREAVVAVSQALSKFQRQLRRPPAEPHLMGGMTLEVEDEHKICAQLVRELYSAAGGARAVQDQVWNRVTAQVQRAWLDERIGPGSCMTLKPDPLDEEPFLLDLGLE